MSSRTEAVTAGYRRQQLALRAVTVRDVVRLWPALDWQQLEKTYPAWFAAVSGLVERDRGTASTLAGRYLQAVRMVEAVPGSATITPAPPIAPEQLATSARVTSIVAYRRGLGAGMTATAASQNALVQATGSLSRLVLDAGRDTIRLSIHADRAGVGYRRVGNPKCQFCKDLIGYGRIYSEQSAFFQSHDHCTCTAEPVYDARLAA